MSTLGVSAQVFLAELRRFAGDKRLSACIIPMEWNRIAKEAGLSDQSRSEAITELLWKKFIAFHPETTQIIMFSPDGIEMADQLIRQGPKVSDAMPDTLDGIRAELDYWELHLNDGEPDSNHWKQVKARIDGLRHREKRFLPAVSIINNAIGANSRVNHGSMDQSVNLLSDGGVGSVPANKTSESESRKPRFREGNEPIGVFWSAIPAHIKKAPVSEIRLASGPAMWLRLIPAEQSHLDLSLPMQVKQNIMSNGKLWLSPLNWVDIGFIRAVDGFGVYARLHESDAETNSVAFVFETGQVWSIDTGSLAKASETVQFVDLQNAMCSRLPLYKQFVHNLGIKPPFRWIAGLDGISGRRLDAQLPGQEMNHLGEPFLEDRIVCQGTYDGSQEPRIALGSFFREVSERSCIAYPNDLQVR